MCSYRIRSFNALRYCLYWLTWPIRSPSLCENYWSGSVAFANLVFHGCKLGNIGKWDNLISLGGVFAQNAEVLKVIGTRDLVRVSVEIIYPVTTKTYLLK